MGGMKNTGYDAYMGELSYNTQIHNIYNLFLFVSLGSMTAVTRDQRPNRLGSEGPVTRDPSL
jgi:hypothetical protein